MDYNKGKYKICLIKELKYFRSVLIFLFFTFLLNSYLPAQMQKIYSPFKQPLQRFGYIVKVYDDFALIFQFPNGNNTINVFKKVGKNNWTLKQIIENEDMGLIYDNHVILPSGGKKMLDIYERNGDYINLSPIDSIININSYYIHSYNFSNNWLVIRLFYIIPFPLQTKYCDYFYKFENNKLILYNYFCQTAQNIDYRIYGFTEKTTNNSNTAALSFIVRNVDGEEYYGKVDIYRFISGAWKQTQELFEPDVQKEKSKLGYCVSLSPSGTFLAASTDLVGDVYIYKNINDTFKLFQTISIPSEQAIRTLKIIDDELLIGNTDLSPNPKQGIRFYKLINDVWIKQNDIHPPPGDNTYNYFGQSIDRFGETVITGVPYDTKYGLGAGSAYIFQIPARDTVTTSICKGEGYTVGDTTYYESGTYRDTLIASYGVDSVVVLNLTVLSVNKSQIDTLLCEGESLTVGDKTLSETGTYEIKLKNTFGCDSTVNVKLRMIKRDYHLPDTTLCYGKTLTIGNQKITESGIYNIPLKNINACDSIIHIKVDFIPPDIVIRDTSVCSGETLIINGEEINEPGSYNFPLFNKYGCDSTVTYNVKFNNSDEIKIDTSICEGKFIKVGDQSFTQSGKYLINLQNISGCDSIIELSLKMLRVSRKELDTILCPDQSIKIGNQEISGSGHYQITLQNSSGCDSIIDLTVKRTELDTSVSILNDIGCASGAIELTAESNAPPLQYLWSNGSIELSNTGLLKGKYELRITDNAGCKYVLQFDVPDRKPYYIPEVFTPDDQNDELNRTFRIFTTDPEDIEPRVKVHSIKIFNRWGETVYSSESNSFWDGTFRKSPAPAGVYLYSIAIESPCSTENVKGQVLLLR